MDYTYISEKFDINSISKCILSIQLSLDGFSFVLSQAENKESPDYIYFKNFEDKSAENLHQALSSLTDFDNKDLFSIRIIFHEKIFTLVPEILFDQGDIDSYLTLNHPTLHGRKNISCRIPAAEAVSVFSVNENLYDLLKNKFPGAEYCHSSLPFCTQALNSNTDGCFIQCYESTMEIAATRNNKLVFYNIFEIQDFNDMVYFTLNAFKSSNLNPTISPLLISGMISEKSEFIAIAGKYIKNIRVYKTGYSTPPEPKDFQYHSQYFLNHREILNCEL